MKRTVLLCILFVPFSLTAAEGSLYLSPAYGAYAIGEVFEVKIFADSDGASVNAAEAEIEFDPDELQVESLSTEGSILSSWSTEPYFSNDAGAIRFAGWALEHYTGREGLLATITFRALKPARSNARLAAGALLAADPIATNIVTGMHSGVYAVHGTLETEPNESTLTPSVPEIISDDPLLAPLFTEYPHTILRGERLIVKGRVAPDVSVRIWMGMDEVQEPVAAVRSSSDGTFTFASAPLSEMGLYRVWADARRGTLTSEISERIVVTVESPGFSGTLGGLSDFLWSVLPYALLLLIAGVIAGYLLHRHAIEKMKHAPSSR